MAFTHLHVHSEYSLLDGMSRISEAPEYVKSLGMDSLAITELLISISRARRPVLSLSSDVRSTWLHALDLTRIRSVTGVCST